MSNTPLLAVQLSAFIIIYGFFLYKYKYSLETYHFSGVRYWSKSDPDSAGISPRIGYPESPFIFHLPYIFSTFEWSKNIIVARRYGHNMNVSVILRFGSHYLKANISTLRDVLNIQKFSEIFLNIFRLVRFFNFPSSCVLLIVIKYWRSSYRRFTTALCHMQKLSSISYSGPVSNIFKPRIFFLPTSLRPSFLYLC